MKIYLSWSGELGRRASKSLGSALQQLIPTLKILSPPSDVSAGARWVDQTHNAIRGSQVALVCVTNDSRGAPWQLYELGVLASSEATVVPWLVDIEPSDLEGPLQQIQALRSDAQSFRRLVALICQRESMQPPSQSDVDRLASRVEKEMNQLAGRGRRTPTAVDTTEWLAQIDSARTARNRDQLNALLGSAYTEGLSDPTVLRALLNAYFDLREFEGVIETWHRFQTTMRQDPEALYCYAYALLRTGKSSDAIVILEDIRESGALEAQKTALLARAYKDQWRERTAQGNPVTAEESLRRAAHTYAEGFMQYRDYYLGLNAVACLHLLGDEGSVRLRDNLLPSVQLAIETAAKFNDDYSTLAGLLDLAVIKGAGVEARGLAKQLRFRVQDAWQIESTIQNLRVLSTAKGFGGNPPGWLPGLLEELAEAGH